MLPAWTARLCACGTVSVVGAREACVMDWGTVGVYAAFGLGYLTYQGWKSERPTDGPRNPAAPSRPSLLRRRSRPAAPFRRGVDHGDPLVPAEDRNRRPELRPSHDALVTEVALLRSEASTLAPRPSKFDGRVESGELHPTMNADTGQVRLLLWGDYERRNGELDGTWIVEPDGTVTSDGTAWPQDAAAFSRWLGDRDVLAELLLTQVWRCIDDNVEPDAALSTLTEPYLRLRLRYVRFYRAVIAALTFQGAARARAFRELSTPELTWYVARFTEEPGEDLTVGNSPSPDDIRRAVTLAGLG